MVLVDYIGIFLHFRILLTDVPSLLLLEKAQYKLTKFMENITFFPFPQFFS